MTEPIAQPELSLAHELQLDDLCVQFEEASRGESPPDIEDYLGRADAVLKPFLLRELLAIELDCRARNGAAANRDDYLARFPEYGQIVEQAFAQFATAADGSSGGTTSPSEYQIVSQLGASRAGLSYRAIRTGDGTEVDIVVLNQSDPQDAARFSKRIRLAEQLQHPSANRIWETRLNGGQSSVVLEPLSERRLADAANLDVAQAARELLAYGCQAASVVAAAHRLGLVHGGLTPDAIRVRADGTLQVDFVRPSPPEDTALHDDDETQAYTKSSGLGDEPDAADDVQSLSSLLVWLFTRERAQPRERLGNLRDELLQRIASCDESASLVEDLCAAVVRALNSDPGDRGTAQTIDRRLAALADAERIPRPRVDGDDVTVIAQIPAGFEMPTQGDESFADTNFLGLDNRELPDRIGRFRLVRRIGAGGMGEVYEAEDTADGTRIALKVLNRRVLDHPQAVQRFYKEGRLLGQINSPYVTNLIEVNEDAGLHYIAMEFVSGTDLGKLIRFRAPFEEKFALALIADALRGLVGAHELGMIHRDIKPANILLSHESGDDGCDVRLIKPTAESLKQLRVKLSDFGLARQIDQSESMQLTHTGMLLGTPTYMSPEQFSDITEVGQATDVYAMGITLFEMLTGRPPFEAGDAATLMNMHCHDAAPPANKYNPDVSEATCALVQRALAKDPHDRFADAGQFLREIERLLRGDATSIEIHPHVPPHDPQKIFEEVFEWELEGAAADLWPYVSNTDRINCAVGVPSVVYETRRDERGRLRKYGEFRMAGLQIGWEEHPFEWVEGQRLGILREFQKGPFEWFLSIVELFPQAGGGTKLRHTVRINPRGLVGRLVAAMEVSVKGKRALNRVYGRIDQSVTGRLGNAPTTDPFIEPERLSKARGQRLETRLDRLAEKGIAPEVVETLGELLRQAPAQELGRIRPLAVARHFDVDGPQFVNGCLQAAREGLLTVAWDILCPTCRISAKIADTLREIERHARCEVCDLDFDVDLANSLELIFQAHPEIRAADVGTYCIGGPEHSPHVVVQIRMAPGERAELSPVLSEGEYVLRSAQLTCTHQLRVLPLKGTTHGEIVLTPGDDTRTSRMLRAGRVELAVTNNYDHEVVIRLERRIPLADVFTAAQASALPAFRDLFPEESFRSGQLFNVSTATLLVVDLADVDRLFEELGDADAYARVERFHLLADQQVRRHAGAIIETRGTTLLCAFDSPRDVLQSMMSLATELEQDPYRDLRFQAGAHRGTVLATSDDGRLEYFGATVQVVTKLPGHARAGELVLTEAIAQDPLVAELIGDSGLSGQFCRLPLPGGHGERCQRLPLSKRLS